MEAVNGHILIRPDGDIETAIRVSHDDAWRLAVTGTVVSPPCVHTDNGFLNWARKRYRNNYPPGVLAKMRYFTATTPEISDNYPLNEGDRVLFSYLVHGNEWGLLPNGNLVCKIDSLVCKLEPIVPLNNYVLFEMDEEFNGFVKDANTYRSGVVTHIGKICTYRDGGRVDPKIEVGDRIFFNKKAYVRLEADAFNTLTEKNSSLFRISRRDVLGMTKISE